MKIVFFGTKELAKALLESLIESSYEICAIVTKPDRPFGRGRKLAYSPVKELALKFALKATLFQPETTRDPSFCSELEKIEADIFVVTQYGEIIRKNLLEMPRWGSINLHGSLLPKYRGAAPIQHALLNGEKKTGVTVIKMTPRMDDGPMLARKDLPIEQDDCYQSVMEKMCRLGPLCVIDVLKQIELGEEHLEPQDENLVTFASKITEKDLIIDWSNPLEKILNQVRAFSPDPSCSTTIMVEGERKKLKILQASSYSNETALDIAHCRFFKKKMLISCSDGWLSVDRGQLSGKKKMSGLDLYNGLFQKNCRIIKN